MIPPQKKLREFWLIYERPCSPWISNKPLFSADTDEEIHVREINSKIDCAVEACINVLELSVSTGNRHISCQCKWDERGYRLSSDPECLTRKQLEALELYKDAVNHDQ